MRISSFHSAHNKCTSTAANLSMRLCDTKPILVNRAWTILCRYCGLPLTMQPAKIFRIVDWVVVNKNQRNRYLNFALFSFIIITLELCLEPIQKWVTVDISTMNDNHLPEVKMTEQSGPYIRLVEKRSYRPQKWNVNILWLSTNRFTKDVF